MLTTLIAFRGMEKLWDALMAQTMLERQQSRPLTKRMRSCGVQNAFRVGGITRTLKANPTVKVWLNYWDIKLFYLHHLVD